MRALGTAFLLIGICLTAPVAQAGPPADPLRQLLSQGLENPRTCTEVNPKVASSLLLLPARAAANLLRVLICTQPELVAGGLALTFVVVVWGDEIKGETQRAIYELQDFSARAGTYFSDSSENTGETPNLSKDQELVVERIGDYRLLGRLQAAANGSKTARQDLVNKLPDGGPREAGEKFIEDLNELREAVVDPEGEIELDHLDELLGENAELLRYLTGDTPSIRHLLEHTRSSREILRRIFKVYEE